MENQQIDEQQKRGRGRPRKGEVVVKPPKIKKEFVTHDPDYYKNYYKDKIKPIKDIKRKLKREMKQQIKDIQNEEIQTTTNNIINKIKSVNNQDDEIQKLCKIMKLICEKLEIEIE